MSAWLQEEIALAGPTPPPPRPRQSAFAMGRRVQIAQAVADADLATAANLIRNSPGLDWATFVPAAYHAALWALLGGAS